jgi:hypothetical protein
MIGKPQFRRPAGVSIKAAARAGADDNCNYISSPLHQDTVNDFQRRKFPRIIYVDPQHEGTRDLD